MFAGSFGVDSKIKTITVDSGNPVYYMEDGVLYANLTEENIPDDSSYIAGLWLIKYPSGRDETSFTVPEGVVGIEQHAFVDCTDLTEVILPDSLHTIGAGAFWECSGLTKLELPGNLKKIYDSTIDQCTGLVELVIPASVELIGGYLEPNTPNFDRVVFLGDMPEMFAQTFSSNRSVDVYYPAGNTTWEAALQMYAGYDYVQWHEACATHQFVSKTQGVTCVLTGYTGQECSVCGLVEVTGELIPPTGHDLVRDGMQEPSCEDWGVTFYRCTACGKSIAEGEVAPLGHNYDENGNCLRCVADDTQLQEFMKYLLLIMLGILAVIAIPVVIVNMARRRK